MKNLIFFANLLIVIYFLITFINLSESIFFSPEIKLVIKGVGQKNILNNSFNLEPSEVKIDGISNNCKKICKFTKENNNITLYYNNSIKTCENMFSLLQDIIEFDFSKFDFSQVTSTKKMFYKNMESMFSGCSSLESIDLSKFTTNKINSLTSVFFGM